MDEMDARAQVYFIPHNFVETGTLFNGLVRIRNFFEGLLLAALPVPILIQIPNMTFTDRITLFVTCCGALGLLGFVGIDGESLTQYLFKYIRFRRRRTTARYNPRVKLEAVPDYLENKDGNLPRDRILKMINSIRNRSVGEDDEYGGVSSELFDKETNFFFEDDIGILEKPDELLTRAERKSKTRKKSRKEKPSRKIHRAAKGAKKAASPQKAPVKPVAVSHPGTSQPLHVDLVISTAAEYGGMPIFEQPRQAAYSAKPPGYQALEVSLNESQDPIVYAPPAICLPQTHNDANHDSPFVTMHGLSKNIITVSNIVP